MAKDYLINVFLDDEKIKKLEKAGLGDHITEAAGKKVIKVILPPKNQRKFGKAFPKTVLNDQTGEVDNFPEDSANLLFDVIIENEQMEVMHLFLVKAYNPLAGIPLRTRVH
jgi:hypothetical protein